MDRFFYSKIILSERKKHEKIDFNSKKEKGI